MVTFCTAASADAIAQVMEVWSHIPISLVIIVVFWLASAIAIAVLTKKKVIFTAGQKKVDAAEKAGRVIYAEFERSSHAGRHENLHNYNTYKGIYGYTVNGKHYRKVVKQYGKGFEKYLKLYYTRSPAFAKTEGELKLWSEEILPRIVPLVLTMLLYLLIGPKDFF